MSESHTLTYTHTDLVTLMVKDRGLHEGLWALYVELQMQGGNAGPTPAAMTPVVIVPIMKIGLQRISDTSSLHGSNLCVDAAVVNPRPTYDSFDSIIQDWK